MNTPDGPKRLRAEIDLLWNPERTGRRGPKPQLTAGKIARAGIRIADAEGLGAVSMQRVATELGYTTMSLYNHVPGKQQLLDLMFDIVAAPDPDETLRATGWRDAVGEWAQVVWRIYLGHPWTLEIRTAHTPIGPGNLARLEQLLAALEPSGLPPEETMAVALHILTTLRGMAKLTIDADPELSRWIGPELAEHIDPHRFPRFTAVLAGLNGDVLDDDEPGTLPAAIRFGLDRLLDGITVQVGG